MLDKDIGFEAKASQIVVSVLVDGSFVTDKTEDLPPNGRKTTRLANSSGTPAKAIISRSLMALLMGARSLNQLPLAPGEPC